jgi:Mn-containing catalase
VGFSRSRALHCGREANPRRARPDRAGVPAPWPGYGPQPYPIEESFNFRNRQGARPFFDLIANIAAEEFGHIEVVSAAINSMLTGAGDDDLPPSAPLEGLKDLASNPHHFVAGGLASLPQNSQGRPWNGDYVFSSGDLVQDLTHNFFLESGARREKLRVYETVDHPAARALTGYLLVRGGVHQVAYARAVELLTGADLSKLFPSPNIPTDKIPECKPHIQKGEHLKLYRFSPEDYREIAAVFTGPHPETGEELEVVDHPPEGFVPVDLPAQRAVSTPDYSPELIAEIARKLRVNAGLGDEPLGEVIPANGGLVNKAKGVVDKVTP